MQETSRSCGELGGLMMMTVRGGEVRLGSTVGREAVGEAT